ncbi:MAG: FCD domain-containing protein [Aeromicrobium sp.]
MAKVRRSSTRARSAIFAPIGDEGRAERVEKRLAQAITSGILTDGERLPSEPELASMLGVATVTAREALVALRSQGLVTTTRGRGGGSFVTRPKHPDDEFLKKRLALMTRVELRDRATLYSVILCGCAELAARHADDNDVAGLRELLPSEQEDNVGHWRHAEAELYLSLAALTQSARMTRELVRLESDFGALMRMPYSDPKFCAEALLHNTAIVDAVERRDGDAARKGVRDHVNAALEWVAEMHATLR